MASVYSIIERNQTANGLAMQCALRIGGLVGIGILGAVRKSLDTYLVCLQHGVEYVRQSRITDSPEKFVASYADAMSKCAEKSWQDFRNNLQIWLLAQDEALIWIARLDKALLVVD